MSAEKPCAECGEDATDREGVDYSGADRLVCEDCADDLWDAELDDGGCYQPDW